MSRFPVTVTIAVSDTGTSRTSSALPQPQPQGQAQGPQQQLLAPSSATQQRQTRRRSSAAINADQLLRLGATPQRNMSLARGPDEAPSTSTSPSVPGSRRNSQAFLRRQSVPSTGPLPPDPNDLFIRVKFDGILEHLTHLTNVLTQPHDQIRRSARLSEFKKASGRSWCRILSNRYSCCLVSINSTLVAATVNYTSARPLSVQSSLVQFSSFVSQTRRCRCTTSRATRATCAPF